MLQDPDLRIFRPRQVYTGVRRREYIGMKERSPGADISGYVCLGVFYFDVFFKEIFFHFFIFFSRNLFFWTQSRHLIVLNRYSSQMGARRSVSSAEHGNIPKTAIHKEDDDSFLQLSPPTQKIGGK